MIKILVIAHNRQMIDDSDTGAPTIAGCWEESFDNSSRLLAPILSDTMSQCHNVTMSLTHGNKGLIIPRHYNNAPCRPMNEALTTENAHKLQQLKALTRVPPQSDLP